MNNPITFDLTISLGNDAMQSPQDVARALRFLAEQLAEFSEWRTAGIFRDLNGNAVGTFEVKQKLKFSATLPIY